jgi:hypothetical protein
MTVSDLATLLAEWDCSRDRSVPEHLQAVETAMFLEDTFGIVVPDAAINPELLTVPGMRAALAGDRDR